jgi:hypothetical protein
MVDLASFQAAAGSLKVASDIAKAILDLRDEAKIRAKVMELQRAIIDAQSSTLGAQTESLAHIEQIRELKQRIVDLEDWAREKQRYELHEIRSGAFTYSLKSAMSNGEPPHQICAKCYQDGVKSILQKEIRVVGRVHALVCHRCQAELVTQGMVTT